MTTKFVAEMLTLARDSRGLTRASLAQKTDLSPSLISKFESGVANPSPENLAKLADALGYPLEFLGQMQEIHGLGCSFLYHRQRQSMPVPEQRRIVATVNVLRIQMQQLLGAIDITAENQFQPQDVEQDGGPEKIAAGVRAAWKLPLGPVRNVVGAIESAGGVVIRYPFGNRKADGMSIWLTGLPPLFFLNADMPGDRSRFTLAHELGHVIMHRQPTERIENEADRFAAEFLMPAREIRPDLGGMSLERAAALKPLWKVSMQALIRRAWDLDVVPESRYRRLCTLVSMAGYRTNEPVPIAIEEPTLLREIVNVHLGDHGYTIDDLSKLAFVSREEFCETYVPEAANRLRIHP
ncbi:MAG: XRE family transcriptional regulator [Phycisphaerae bacterium]|nr:XRE family transcriptional regulator [Phycisphaerae bacterium]